MKFSELVAYKKEFGLKKTDLLVAISSFFDYDSLVRQLGLLSRQTHKNFNVLIILGVPFDDKRLEAHLRKRKYPFGVTIAKENERRGCTGGFFAAQKYALENKYPYLIMSDDDCMPVDRGLLSALYRNRGRGYVAPTMRFVEDGYRKKGFPGAPTSYSLLSSEVLKKYGLYYLPLFHGADDAEYTERLGMQPHCIKNFVEHPYIVGMRLFGMFDRAWLFLLQAIIITKNPVHTVYNLAVFSFLTCTALFFLPQYGKRLFFLMNRLLFSYTYGKSAFYQLKSGYEKCVEEKRPSDFSGFSAIRETDPSSIDAGGKRKLWENLSEAAGHFRKDVVIEKTYSFMRAFFLSIAARRLYVSMGRGKYLKFSDNGPLPLHALRLALFFVALPVQFALSLCFLPIKMLRQPKTMGYGLD